MKKKTKIVAIMLSLCMSVSMLTIGVLAASQVSLNVSSSVSFQSTGAYIMATGQVKRGTETSLANLTEEDRPAGDTDTGLSYSYTGYSYTPIGSGSDVNAPDGSASKDLDTWNIGSIEFLESKPVVQYEITFKNYGEADVEISITGMPESIPNVEIVGTSLPITVTSGQTEVYTLTLTLTKFNVSIDPAIQVNLNTSMVSKNVAVTPEPDTYTVNYEITGSAGTYSCICIYADNEEKLYIESGGSYSLEGLVTGSFTIKKGQQLQIYGSKPSNLNIMPRAFLPAEYYGYIYEVYNDDQVLVATADSAVMQILSSEGLPYTVNGNIKIIIKTYYDSIFN